MSSEVAALEAEVKEYKLQVDYSRDNAFTNANGRALIARDC